MFKKIMVPVDGSVSSFDALDVAIDMANSLHADLAVMTVIKTIAIQGWAVGPELKTGDDNYDDEKKMAAHILKMALIKAEKVEGKVESYNKFGNPAETIVETAEKAGCDCIVVGSKGLSGIKEAFLGSVSSSVAHIAKMPVLIVK